ncbi:hypothetical protein QBE52_04685 [Clostridiaceae bacterium 35-E11]
MILKLIKKDPQQELHEINKLKQTIKLLKQTNISKESTMLLQIYDNELSDTLKHYLSL